MGDASEIYPLARDPIESRRVWLVEAQAYLNEKVSNDSNRFFHGFDISDAQFLTSPPAGIELSVQDILKPFPAEHHNRYDLVNVRMLVAALKEPEYEKAVKNLMTILSKPGVIQPGGYLQWVDLDSLELPNSEDTEHPRTAELVRYWLKFLEINGLSLSPPTAAERACERAGMVEVSNTFFALNDSRGDFRSTVQEWQADAFAAIVPGIMAKFGEAASIEEAREKVDEALQGLWEFYHEGKVVGLRFGSVVGKKIEE
ncbi:hypothetical protein BDV18DRAFT_150554 [Aspergillus unguis]